MSPPATERPAGDQCRVSVAIAVPQQMAFELFTREIDRWWRRGPKFRNAGSRRGFVHLEAGVGGRLFESIDSDGGERVFEVGRIEIWEPPSRLAFTWRNSAFAANETTHVEVVFAPTSSGTMVTVVHRGWASLRPDHPARHRMSGHVFSRNLGQWWGDQMTSLRQVANGLSGP